MKAMKELSVLIAIFLSFSGCIEQREAIVKIDFKKGTVDIYRSGLYGSDGLSGFNSFSQEEKYPKSLRNNWSLAVEIENFKKMSAKDFIISRYGDEAPSRYSLVYRSLVKQNNEISISYGLSFQTDKIDSAAKIEILNTFLGKITFKDDSTYIVPYNPNEKAALVVNRSFNENVYVLTVHNKCFLKS
ncbi:MAG: hypothetical protein JNL74_05875, partial [Fibrobacteres bacterium]|nr:hypothetical protein [Fibrobacterota bacterium]